MDLPIGPRVADSLSRTDDGHGPGVEKVTRVEESSSTDVGPDFNHG